MDRNGHGIAEEAALSPVESADEALVMGLRLREGIDADAIARRFGLSAVVDWNRVDRLVGSGYLERSGGHIRLTAPGRLLLDHILGEIALGDLVATATDEAVRPAPRPEAATAPVRPVPAVS
jgi:oxygen-independent coproporphyrinogen-3 oxidase